MQATPTLHSTGGQHIAPVVIGLTGPIASGKSTVAGLLHEYGAAVIDADDVYASLMQPGSLLLTAVAERFGSGVIRADGQLDRAALGKIVTKDRRAFASLDRLTHPPVVGDVRRRIALASAPVVVIEAIKLAQSGLLQDVDTLWLVTADREARIARLMKRGALDRPSAQSRVDASSDPLPDGVVPDVIIDNSGEWSETRLAVDKAWRSLSDTARGSLSVGVKEEGSR